MYIARTHDPAADVIYIHPAKQGVGAIQDGQPSNVPYAIMPVGVIGLMNLLRRDGITVWGLNEPLERLINPDFDLALCLRVQPRPRLILIDLHWYEHCYGALEVARACRATFAGVPIVVGGLTASGFAPEILAMSPDIDVIIRGDAEEPLRLLARAALSTHAGLSGADLAAIPNLAYRREGRIVLNPLGDCAGVSQLEALDFVSVDWLEHAHHYRGAQYVGDPEPYDAAEGSPHLGHWLCVGRGCRFNCSYCGGGAQSHRELAGRQELVFRSASVVAADLERLAAEGVHQVALSLDPCLMGAPYWTVLFEEMSRRKVRIGLYNECFHLPPAEFVLRFAGAVDLRHSELALSVLSREAIRRRHGKEFGDAQLFRALSLLRDRQVPISIYFSLNLPGETEEGFRRTLLLAERIARSYPPRLLRMFGQPHTVDPASPMSRHPEQFGIALALRTFRDYYDYCRATGGAAAEAGALPESLRHGYDDAARRDDEVGRIEQAWADFCRRQPFECL